MEAQDGLISLPTPLQISDESMTSVGSKVPYVNDQILLQK